MSSRGQTRRAALALAASSLAVLAAHACAEPQRFEVPEGGGGTGADNGPPAPECGIGAVRCGDEGCCSEGSSCVAGGCIPNVNCELNDQCSGDSACANGSCLSWTEFPAERSFDNNCRDPVELSQVQPTVQCRWPREGTKPAEHPDSVQVVGTPMVVDFDFDNTPDQIEPSIVFVSYEGGYDQGNGVLRVIDGKSCELQATIDAYRFIPEVPPALGDMDGDGHPEIVAGDRDNSGPAIEPGLSVWSIDSEATGPAFRELGDRSTLGNSADLTAIAIHDLDDALPPEVLTENTLFEFDPESGLNPLDFIEGRDAEFEAPVVIDINLDQQQEMVTAQGIMMWERELGQLLTVKTGEQDLWGPEEQVLSTFLAVADLGQFGTELIGGADSAEIVVGSDAEGVLVRLIDGNQVFVDSSSSRNGPPVIADFDGDDKMEFGVPGRVGSGVTGSAAFTVYDLDCVGGSLSAGGSCGGGRGKPSNSGILWRKTGLRGAKAGAAVFDFDGDGKAEVVQADQCYMRVYDGITGEVLFSAPRNSVTAWEYPVVADVDGDRFSEIVTASNTDNTTVSCTETDTLNSNATVARGEPFAGVSVWKEQTDRWMGSRPVWNQQNYYVTNVGDDGSIPEMSEAQNHWFNGPSSSVPNTFRRNVQGATGTSLNRADITTAAQAEIVACDDGRAVVRAYVCNRGIEPLAAGQAEVEFGASPAGDVFCSESYGDALLPGECGEVTCRLPPRGQVRFDVKVKGDPGEDVAECWEGNNESSIAGVFCLEDVR